MFIGDIVLIAFLSLHAYQDGTFIHTILDSIRYQID